MSAQLPDVAVVGSVNLDTTLRLARLPLAGETVLAEGSTTAAGGKGANQAVALARLGRWVAFVGCLGRDAAGDALAAQLSQEGVDLRHVRRVADAATGAAHILVDAAGENIIAVDPGTNGLLEDHDVERAGDAVAQAQAVLAQLEVPVAAVLAAARAARGTFVLNPAPARPLPGELLDRVDVLVPNRGELAALVGAPMPRTLDEVGALALRTGVRIVVVTLGAEGALVVHGAVTEHVPPIPVDVVDTTGAGDAFCGALVDALLDGRSPVGSARWAVRAAALAVTGPGAQSSLPTRSEVANLEIQGDGA